MARVAWRIGGREFTADEEASDDGDGFTLKDLLAPLTETPVQSVAADRTVNDYATVEAHKKLIAQPIFPVMGFETTDIYSMLLADELAMLALLGLTDVHADWNAALLYERLYRLCKAIDMVSQHDVLASTIFEEANADVWLRTLADAYSNPKLAILRNAAELNYALNVGKYVDDAIMKKPKPPSSKKSFVTSGKRRGRDDSSDDADAGSHSGSDEPAAPPPPPPTDQDAYAAEKALQRALQPVLGPGIAINRYSFPIISKRADFIKHTRKDPNLAKAVTTLQQFLSIEEQQLGTYTVRDKVDKIHTKINYVIERLRADGDICVVENCCSDPWSEAVTPFDYMRCGVVWPNVVSVKLRDELVYDVRCQIWTCVAQLILNVLRKLLELKMTTPTAVHASSQLVQQSGASPQEQGEALHLQRFRCGDATALGVLDTDRARAYPRFNDSRDDARCTSDAFVYTEEHGVLAFYVHQMSAVLPEVVKAARDAVPADMQ